MVVDTSLPAPPRVRSFAVEGCKTTTSSARNAPLYQRDPEAWQAHLKQGNATQPRKRVSVDVLLRDRIGRILLVDPKYKPDWDLPGGMAEANEPPHQAVQRELAEEFGLNFGRVALGVGSVTRLRSAEVDRP